jgi:fructokinase
MTTKLSNPPRVIGLGELLWDLLPAGAQMGGAPANFAYHAARLGAQAAVITRVGADARGDEIVARLQTLGLSARLVQRDPTSSTGTVTVALSGDGLPDYTIHENVAWDFLEATPDTLEAAAEADALCFGSLAQRNPVSRGAIEALVRATPLSAWRILDVNLRQQYFTEQILRSSMEWANLLKLNDVELPVLSRMFRLDGDERKQVEALATMFDLRLVALTRGAQGSLLYCDGQWAEHVPPPVPVVDTVGAGDAFTAALCMGLLAGNELQRINIEANRLAGWVCSQAGATPRY